MTPYRAAAVCAAALALLELGRCATRRLRPRLSRRLPRLLRRCRGGAEIETLVIRDRDVAARLDEIGTPRRAWSEPVSERLPRADLIRIANAYFSGIERNDGKDAYPLAADCARLENGLVLAGDPALVSPRAKGRPSGQQIGCLEQFRSGIFFYVTRIRDRRFVLVDPERGLIGPVESVLHQVSYSMGSGWSTWQESLSSEPRG